MKKDLTGQKIGEWQVIKIHEPNTNSHGEIVWDCICPCCGNIVSKTYYQLHTRVAKGCTKCKGKNCAKDIKGQRFGRLTAIQYIGSHKGQCAVWECLCDCGNIVNVSTNCLYTGGTKSCGCLNKEQLLSPKNDLTDKQFGFLKVLEYTGNNSKNNGSNWKCKCENCGTEVVVTQHCLMQGQISCGCVKSKSEVFIAKFLNDHHLNYKKQYQFDDLKSTKGYPLRFDFAVFDDNDKLNFLIEYQGEQHYEATKYWGGQEGLNQRIEYDNIKKQYCNNNKIKLIEITCFDNLEQRLQEVLYEN